MMSDNGIDACAKCKLCGHSRWQHQDMETIDRSQSGKYQKVPAAECRAGACDCTQYEEPCKQARRGR